MAKKYDTNPLDPEFPQKAREMQTETFSHLNAETQRFPFAAPTEEQTRKFNDAADFSGYSSPFDGQNIPANFQTEKLNADAENTSKRKVAKVGLPENVLIALPYIPFQIGLVAGLIELFLVPKSETRVRFHAAQGLAVNVAILIVATILKTAGHITDLADFGNMIFYPITIVMLFIWTIKAWKGKPVHIEAVDDLTNWLEEKIKPRG
ncbi:MAG: hypothetical protein M3525_16225 [Acidobacteriota bacterium]|nr:hypothetical protein [Acidobacteriota bacterium]